MCDLYMRMAPETTGPVASPKDENQRSPVDRQDFLPAADDPEAERDPNTTLSKFATGPAGIAITSADAWEISVASVSFFLRLPVAHQSFALLGPRRS